MKDHLNNVIKLNKTPQRIISLVPSQTELVVDLGMQKQLVGVTKFCVHPKSIKKDATVVGGTKSIHLEKIKALQPDLILCNKEENTAQMVAKLQKIAPVHISNVITFNDAYQLILDYGKLFQKDTEANVLVQQIKLQFQKLQFHQNKKIKIGYFIWKDPWMVAANSTFIHAMLCKLGFCNAFDDLERYPVVDLDNLPDIDWVFLSSEPFPFTREHYSAFTNKRIKLQIVDGECFSWYGSRLLKSVDYFKTLLKEMKI